MIACLAAGHGLNGERVDKILRKANGAAGDPRRTVNKRTLLPYYQQLRDGEAGAVAPAPLETFSAEKRREGAPASVVSAGPAGEAVSAAPAGEAGEPAVTAGDAATAPAVTALTPGRAHLAALGWTPAMDAPLTAALMAKPRRSASGVATITVLTRPHPCSSNCLYCPSDLRMPKSYMAAEPACQRAERVWFDPYLQVHYRLKALKAMGHPTQKIELIVLGGTWSDYPQSYRLWFALGLFEALNDAGDWAAAQARAQELEAQYLATGAPREPQECAAAVAALQAQIDAGELTYNQAWERYWAPQFREGMGAACAQKPQEAAAPNPVGESASATTSRHFSAEGAATCENAAVQAAPPSTLAPAPTWPAIEAAQVRNQRAQHRVVGLVIETRPDLITPAALIEFRRLGATKVQMGIQSLCAATLAANGRATTPAQIAAACALLRTFGFKIHVHMMLNLMGSTPQQDQREYRELVQSPSYSPDEVKLYPCVLVASAALTREAAGGRWRPYSEEALVHVLVEDILATPAWVRVSRMIRDIATGDILAGNKKTNLRQLVEARVERLERAGRPVGEIRHREIVCAHVDAGELALKTLTYATTAATEHFLQWVTPAGAIAGFLRLSLPTRETEGLRNASLAAAGFPLPGLPAALAEKDLEEAPRLAMIREVHVYGRTAELGEQGGGASGVEAQHRGLGKQLIQEAARQAREAGYQGLLVISSVGTREYYAHLGFLPAGLYQYLPLV